MIEEHSKSKSGENEGYLNDFSKRPLGHCGLAEKDIIQHSVFLSRVVTIGLPN